MNLLKFFDSDFYLSLVESGTLPTIRMFETSLQFDAVWMNQHGISFGTCFETTNYQWLNNGQVESTFTGFASKYTNGKNLYCVSIPYNALTEYKPIVDPKTNKAPPTQLRLCVGEEWVKCTPKTVFFDIECNTRLDDITQVIYASPMWTSQRYADRFKSIITDSQHIADIKNSRDPDTARTKGISLISTDEDYKNKYFTRFPELPRTSAVNDIKAHIQKKISKVDETDEVTTIAFVVRQGDNGLSPHSPNGSYVFTWNHKRSSNTTSGVLPLGTSKQIVPLLLNSHKAVMEEQHIKDCHNIRDTSNYFSNITRRVFGCEFDMILGFIQFVKSEIIPDFIGGHNVFNFDLPFLIDRVTELARLNSNYQARLIANPFTIGYLRGHQSRYWDSSYFRAATGFKSSISIECPGMSIMDTLSCFKNSNFGSKMDSYSLGTLMVELLSYPENNEKMRKLEIDIRHARELWVRGGDDQNYYEGYCLYDAVGSAMLCEKKNYIATTFTVGWLSGTNPREIYPRGVQNIVSNMVHLKTWEINNTKMYLIPDYGSRELHFPDLWYAHMDPDAVSPTPRYTAVRELYETVPALKRKWQMGAIRKIPDTRKSKPTSITNRFMPQKGTNEEKLYAYSLEEQKLKQTQNILPKSKPYVGANVLEVLRMLIIAIIMGTLDYESMYPTISASLLMCYSNMVTEFTKKAFRILRMTLCRIVLGPATLIQMGDVLDSPVLAKLHDISDTTQVVYTYFYQRRTTIVGAIIRNLIAHRRSCKEIWAEWINQNDKLKFYSYLLDTYRKTCADIKPDVSDRDRLILETIRDKAQKANAGTKDKSFMAGCYKKANDLLDPTYPSSLCYYDSKAKEWIRWILFEHGNTLTKNIGSDFKLEEPSYDFTNSNTEFQARVKRLLLIAISQNNNYNVEQNGTKLTMNSVYGVLSMASGLLPMIQIGSAITAYGRYLIKMTENVANNMDNILLAQELGIEKHIMDINGNQPIMSFRGIGKNMPAHICGGDTDSVFILFRPEFYPSPLGETLIYGSRDAGIPSVARAYTTEINKYLPKMFVVAKDGTVTIERDIMNIQFENAKSCVLELKKKMAASLTFNENKISAKGLSLKKSDTLPVEAAMEEHILKNILLKRPAPGECIETRVLAAINYARSQIIHLMRGNYNPQQFVMKKKLKQPVEMYASPIPIHAAVAKLKIARGETVVPDTFIPYVYVTDTLTSLKKSLMDSTPSKEVSQNTEDVPSDATPAKKGKTQKKNSKMFYTGTILTRAIKASHTQECGKSLINTIINTSPASAMARSKNYECANYAQQHDLPLDVFFYFNNFIIKKLARLLAPIISNFEEYPRIPYGVTPEEKAKYKKLQANIEDQQIARMTSILTRGEIDDRLKRINLERLQRSITAHNAIMGAPTSFNTPIRRCIECNDCYDEASPEFKEDVTLLYNYIHEIHNAPGLYGICPVCTNKAKGEADSSPMTRRGYISYHTENLEKSVAREKECRETCWKCIDNTRVSVRSSKVNELITKHGKQVFEKNSLIDIYKTEEERRAIYFTNPDTCTLDKCDVFIEKKAASRGIKKETRCINILEQINDW